MVDPSQLPDKPKPEDPPPAPKKTPADEADDHIRIIPLPKIVFFYPTALISLICGITMSVLGNRVPASLTRRQTATAMGWLFLAIFTMNVMIISFDFPGIKFLAVAFATVAVVLGLALVAVYYPDFIPGITEMIKAVRADRDGAVLLLHLDRIDDLDLLGGAMVARYTNVWYLHSMELVHKRGILGDVEKYPTLHMRVTKEITDLFEFLLLMSGSLVMQPSTSERPIVLENVMFINHKEKRIRELLSKWVTSKA